MMNNTINLIEVISVNRVNKLRELLMLTYLLTHKSRNAIEELKIERSILLLALFITQKIIPHLKMTTN